MADILGLLSWATGIFATMLIGYGCIAITNGMRVEDKERQELGSKVFVSGILILLLCLGLNFIKDKYFSPNETDIQNEITYDEDYQNYLEYKEFLKYKEQKEKDNIEHRTIVIPYSFNWGK